MTTEHQNELMQQTRELSNHGKDYNVKVGDELTFYMNHEMGVVQITTKEQASIATHILRSGEAQFTINGIV